MSGVFIPLVLSAGYVVLAVFFPSDEDGGFGNLEAVATLFSHPSAMLAGWIHFLAFDLLIGAWICRTARKDCVYYWLVAPCLPLTFLFGPAGFLAFSIIRTSTKHKTSQISVK
ncbi:ABA4-like family protein [Yoonia sp. R2331]|uniref:ABA4-like family protein n=1 Tax=Yoonia sp. R2331 TaxID=3237238 RepID=UPI0034E46832